SRKDLAHIVNSFQVRDGPRFQTPSEGSSLDQLHGHHELSLDLRCVVEGDDIGMAEAAMYLRFSKEPVHSIPIALHVPGEDSEHLQSSKSDVSDLVQNASLEVVENINKFVAPYCRSDFKCHRVFSPKSLDFNTDLCQAAIVI